MIISVLHMRKLVLGGWVGIKQLVQVTYDRGPIQTQVSWDPKTKGLPR